MASKDMWDSRYASEAYIFGVEPNEFLRQHAEQIPAGGRVLSIGEGEGRNAVFLASLGFQVTAIDSSGVGLAKARALAERRGLTINAQVTDVAELDFGEGVWDGVVSIFCHLPSALRRQVHAHVSRALKPRGVFLLQAYTMEQLTHRTGGPSDPDMLYGEDILRGDLKDLSFEILQELTTELHEGTAHDGRSAVVQMVARRL